jgi:hypothetical protein
MAMYIRNTGPYHVSDGVRLRAHTCHVTSYINMIRNLDNILYIF